MEGNRLLQVSQVDHRLRCGELDIAEVLEGNLLQCIATIYSYKVFSSSIDFEMASGIHCSFGSNPK